MSVRDSSRRFSDLPLNVSASWCESCRCALGRGCVKTYDQHFLWVGFLFPTLRKCRGGRFEWPSPQANSSVFYVFTRPGSIADVNGQTSGIKMADVFAAGRISWSKPLRGRANWPKPDDRGTLGCKNHVLVDQRGLPLVAQISGAQVHDSRLLIPLVEAIPALKGLSDRTRKRPGKLHADRADASRAKPA